MTAYTYRYLSENIEYEHLGLLARTWGGLTRLQE
jgi:hypothetical protein